MSQHVSVTTAVLGGKMTYELACASLDDLELRVEALLRRYNPAGYATDFSEAVLGTDGVWRVTGSRALSCN